MNEKVLKIATYENGWLLTACGQYNFKSRALCPMPGIFGDILYRVLSSLSIPYRLIPSVQEWGRYDKKGYWRDGLFEDLQNGTVDLLATGLTSSELRRRNFTFSFPIIETNYVFLVPGPKKNFGSASLLFEVFGRYIWIALCLCILSYVFCRVCVKLCKFYIGQFKSLSLNTAATVFGFGTVLFVNLYAGSLLTQLIHPSFSPQVRDVFHMIELIESKDIRMIVKYKGGGLDTTIEYSTHPFYEKLRQALEKNPVVYENFPAEKIGRMVAAGGYVYPTADLFAAAYTRHNCSIRTIGQEAMLPATFMGFMFRKKFYLLPRVNEALVALKPPHIDNLVEKYKRWRYPVSCNDPRSKGGFSQHSLNVGSLSGAYVVLFYASLLCLVCFGIEYVFATSKNQSVVGQCKQWGSAWITNHIGDHGVVGGRKYTTGRER